MKTPQNLNGANVFLKKRSSAKGCPLSGKLSSSDKRFEPAAGEKRKSEENSGMYSGSMKPGGDVQSIPGQIQKRIHTYWPLPIHEPARKAMDQGEL